MNKADKIFIIIVIVISLLSYIPLLVNDWQSRDKKKEVVVQYRNEEVLREALDKDATYHLQGTLGEVLIEVKDEAVRVEKENSPYHLCSIQGWVKDAGRVIICLPNEMVVQIETSEPGEHDVDTVIQ